jgi:hypothetical protein
VLDNSGKLQVVDSAEKAKRRFPERLLLADDPRDHWVVRK